MGGDVSNSCPGVSVIIPAYNYGRYLARAIDSALAQKYPNFEVLVIDDGSTDNTPEIAKGYGDRIRYIRKVNAGLSAARNTAIEAARFDFVGFLDADDEWRPQMMAEAMKAFSELPKEYAVVACQLDFVDPSNATLPAKRLDATEPREITCRDIILKTRFFPSAVIARKHVFGEVGGFDTSLRSSEDRNMWIRIAAKYRVFLLSNHNVLIRKHTANMSKNADRMKSNVRKVIDEAYEKRIVPHSAWCFWRQVFSFHYFQNAWRFYDEARYREAIGDMLRSIFLWPCFSSPALLNEPVLFRLRSLIRFTRAAVKGKS